MRVSHIIARIRDWGKFHPSRDRLRSLANSLPKKYNPYARGDPPGYMDATSNIRANKVLPRPPAAVARFVICRNLVLPLLTYRTELPDCYAKLSNIRMALVALVPGNNSERHFQARAFVVTRASYGAVRFEIHSIRTRIFLEFLSFPLFSFFFRS